jgi:hypothetical protein
MDLRRRVLQWLLWFVAVSHLVIGGGAFLSRGFQVQMARFYGAELVITPELAYIAAMGATFMVGLGVAGIAAARDPLRYRAVVAGFAVVLLLRMLQRVTQLDTIEQVFGIPAWRTVGNAVFFGALGLALLVLLATTRRVPAEAEAG